ncbi:hypothetical protein PSOS111911_00975 [Pseudoalteromonas ostreae]
MCYLCVSFVLLQRCNCSSTSSYVQKIITKAEYLANSSNAGFDGNINVINPTDNKIHSLKVKSKWIFKGGHEPSLNTQIYSHTPSAQLVSQVGELSKLKIFEHSRMGKRGIVVPENSGFKSAYDIGRNETNRDLFDDWYHDNYSVSYWARIALDTAGQIGVSLDIFTGIQVQFVFSDQSTARFKVERFQIGDLKFSYVPNSSRNKDGIPIADFGRSFNGEYTFNNELASRGIEIRVVRVGSTGGRVRITEISTSVE